MCIQNLYTKLYPLVIFLFIIKTIYFLNPGIFLYLVVFLYVWNSNFFIFFIFLLFFQILPFSIIRSYMMRSNPSGYHTFLLFKQHAAFLFKFSHRDDLLLRKIQKTFFLFILAILYENCLEKCLNRLRSDNYIILIQKVY